MSIPGRFSVSCFSAPSMVIPPSAGAGGAISGTSRIRGRSLTGSASSSGRGAGGAQANLGNSIILALACTLPGVADACNGAGARSAPDAIAGLASASTGSGSCLNPSSARAWFETVSNAGIEDPPWSIRTRGELRRIEFQVQRRVPGRTHLTARAIAVEPIRQLVAPCGRLRALRHGFGKGLRWAMANFSTQRTIHENQSLEIVAAHSEHTTGRDAAGILALFATLPRDQRRAKFTMPRQNSRKGRLVFKRRSSSVDFSSDDSSH